jgi:creatinine amidohydrolase/Fe(II)-dependent formamide hydrolase-like protein
MANGVMGDPFVASAEKGEALFDVFLDRLVMLCRDYHEADPPRYKEFGSHCT